MDSFGLNFRKDVLLQVRKENVSIFRDRYDTVDSKYYII